MKTSARRRLAGLILSLALTASQGFAALAPNSETRLIPGDAAIFQQFGYAVDLDADTAVVGAPLDSAANAAAGAAYVFVHDGETWAEQAKLLAADAAYATEFGNAVAVRGDTIVVGAHLDPAGGHQAGAAYVFVRTGATWTQQAKLVPADPVAGKQFGGSVAIDGDTVAVGAIADSEGAFNSGAVYIFTRNAGAWTQQAKLLSSDPRPGNLLGFSVTLSGHTLAAGSPFDEDNGVVDSGAVYVFVRSGMTWSQNAELRAPDGGVSDLLGWSVALSGDTLIAGAPQNGGTGAAYSFIRAAGTWSPEAKLVGRDVASGDQFGYSVGLSGDNAVVGSIFDSSTLVAGVLVDFGGSAYLFQRTGGTWNQDSEVSADDLENFDVFGFSVAISGSTIIAGAPFHGGLDDGAAYVFTSTGANTPPIADSQSIATPEETAVSVTLSGTDPEGAVLTYAVLTSPTKGTLSGIAPALTYSPNPNETGPDSFTFKVNDGELDSAIATVSISITPVNEAPQANHQTVTTDEDTAAAVFLTGSDADGDSLAFIVVSGPAKGALTGAAPNLIYTPHPNANGPDSFTFKVNDGALDSGVATVSILIRPVNDAPRAYQGSTTTDEDVAAALLLTGGDIEAEALAFTVLTAPTKGTLSGTAPNLIFTPNPDANGPDSFTFQVNDGTLDSAPAIFTIQINPVNDPPTISDISNQTVNRNSATAPIQFVLGDVDGEVEALTVSALSDNAMLVPTGAFSFGGSGATRTLSVTPAVDQVGTATITVTVGDDSATATDTFVLTIRSENRPPVADASASQLRVISLNGIDAPVRLDASRSSDPDGDPLGYSWLLDGNPTSRARMSLGVAGTVLFGIGSHPVTVEVNDGALSDTDAITIRVISLADAIGELIEKVRAMDLHHGTECSLVASLKSAAHAAKRGRFGIVRNRLEAVLHKIDTTRPKRLSAEDAAVLRQSIGELLEILPASAPTHRDRG